MNTASEMAVRTISPGRRVLFMVLVLAVTLAFFEAAVRARAWLKYGTALPGVSDEMLAFDPKLGLTYPRPGFEVTSGTIAIKINGQGFRGGEISPVKPADTVRIVCVGASTTFSAEVSSNQATWPAQLQNLLEREFPGVAIEVVNAGIPGAVATESLKNLERRVVPLTPDIVVFYEANNDLAIDTRDLARRQGLLSSSEGYLSGPVRALSQVQPAVRPRVQERPHSAFALGHAGGQALVGACGVAYAFHWRDRQDARSAAEKPHSVRPFDLPGQSTGAPRIAPPRSPTRTCRSTTCPG